MKSRTKSFSNIFLPSDSPRIIDSCYFNRSDSIPVIRKNVASRCSGSLEESSNQSVTTENDSGFGSSTEETTTSEKKEYLRQPGALTIRKLFSNTSCNSFKFDGYKLRMVKELRIEDGSVGFGYDKLFSDGLNEMLRVVYVEDPYLYTVSQVCNFVVFCETLVARAFNLEKIVLRTRRLKSDYCDSSFAELKASLLARKIRLEIERSDTIHDREIRFDNGWTYRIGRGLDYFQKQQGVTLGLSNYNFRRCLETLVCIIKEIR